MGRRNDHSPVEFDKMVVDTVWQWLQNQSASDLSLRKIASLIGYAPSTLVSVYGSYALLLLRVNSATLDRLAQSLAVTDPKAPARDRLLDAALGYLNFAREHPHAFRLIFEHKLAEGQSLPPHFCDKLEAMFGLVEAPLSELRPELSASALHLHARMLWASVHGICQLDIDNKLFLQGAEGQALICALLGHVLDKESL